MSARIHYAGREYTVTDRDVGELREQIDGGLLSGVPYWLPVRFGEGRASDAFLLITPGTMIGLIAELDAVADPRNDSADQLTIDDAAGDTGPFDAFAAHSDD